MNDYHRNFGFPSGKKPEGRREWIEYIIGALADIGIEFSGAPEVFEAHNLVKS